jgi:hypothetical protein
MSWVIHARLDDETEKLLVELQIRFGWSNSPVVGEEIKALNGLIFANGKRKIVGVDRTRSGVADLASNNRHHKGFGK